MKTVVALCALCLATVASAECIGTNQALNKPVTASQQLDDRHEAAQAVDGDEGTMWTSNMPAPEWFQVDLQQEQLVTCLRLLPAMLPNGFVSQTIIGVRGTGEELTLTTWEGDAANGVWTEITSSNPTPVRWVRIFTDTSPSDVAWFEVQIMTDQTTPTHPYTWGELKVRYR